MKLLPLGSIIKVNNHNVCIIGYGSVDKDSVSTSGHFVVLYPIGFTSIDKTFFVPHNEEFELISEGYKTAPSEKVLETLSKSLEMVENVSYEELLKINKAFKKAVQKKKEANEE